MERKAGIDLFGASALTAFAAFLALNQIVIKLVDAGIQPVFFAGLRSAIAAACLFGWMVVKRRPPVLARRHLLPGLAAGVGFSVEFIALFVALDLTTVTRTTILMYSMPVWLACGSHFFLPGERLSPVRILGLGFAFAGVVWALAQHGQADGARDASLIGDLCALVAAICWATVALVTRATSLRELRPEMQLFWQVLVSAPIILLVAPFFGPLIRDLQPIHVAGLFYQGVIVVAMGFLFWFWLLSIYPASGVASFSFLTPVFGVAFGWLVLHEQVGPSLVVALALVAVGIVLINRPARA